MTTTLRAEVLEARSLLSADLLAPVVTPTLAIDTGSYDPTRLLVRYRSGAGVAQATAGKAVGLVDGLREISLPEGADFASALASFRSDPNVAYAEPDYAVRLQLVPNDPSFGTQWALHNTGQSGGVIDADIDGPEAWDVTTGSAGTLVAVIDTGINYNHPDLAANMWRNSGEIAGNGLDDDGDGFIDDVFGADFVNNDGDPMDDQGHGTHVAGTIGAVGNNGIGVAGVAWNAKLMALKFLNATGNGSVSAAIDALRYAVAHGAKISNNSWGGDGYSQALYDAIRDAGAAGHIFVAAAGNGGSDGIGDNTDASPFYPSGYNLDNIVSVASTTHTDGLSSFSNYGASSVDLGAPGQAILSTTRTGGYGTMSGTSMATPHVAGVVALVRGQNPTWPYRQVINHILATTDPISALNGKVASGGRLNAARAVAPVTPESQTYTLFPDTAAPAVPSATTQPIEVGVKFRADVAGSVTALRHYRGAGAAGRQVGHLWSAAGVLLASAEFAAGTTPGWQVATLPQPVALTPGETYVASYYTDAGHIAYTTAYFRNGLDRGVLHAPGGANGVFRYGLGGGFPTSTYNSSNYWADVVFRSGPTATDTTTPSVTSVTPTAGAMGVAPDQAVGATFSEPLDPASVTTSTFELLDAGNAPVPATVSYDAATRTASLVPLSPLTSGARYTARLRGGASDPRIKDVAGNALAGDSSWSFTIAASTVAGVSFWDDTAAPAVPSATTQPIEVGVKFRADVAGSVTALRHYRGAGAAGRQVGHLWSAAGVLLASAEFAAGTTPGWQVATLPQPVALTPGETYVASYYTDAGHIAYTTAYFRNGLDRGVLHAPGGANGVFRYGLGGGFPTSTYNSSNYWADVVFTPAGGASAVAGLSTAPLSSAEGTIPPARSWSMSSGTPGHVVPGDSIAAIVAPRTPVPTGPDSGLAGPAWTRLRGRKDHAPARLL